MSGPGGRRGFHAVCDGAPLMRRNAAAGAGAPAKAIDDPGPPQKEGFCGETDPANPKYFMTKRGAGYYLQK